MVAAPHPGAIEVDARMAAVHAIVGRYPDIIAVDMPLAFQPIAARRRSDAMISTLFGAAGAAVYSPNALRPGPTAKPIGDEASAIWLPMVCEDYAAVRTATPISRTMRRIRLNNITGLERLNIYSYQAISSLPIDVVVRALRKGNQRWAGC